MTKYQVTKLPDVKILTLKTKKIQVVHKIVVHKLVYFTFFSIFAPELKIFYCYEEKFCILIAPFLTSRREDDLCHSAERILWAMNALISSSVGN